MQYSNIETRHLLTMMGVVFVLATIILGAPLLIRVVGIVAMCISAYGTKWKNYMPAGLIQDDRKGVPSFNLFLLAMMATAGMEFGEYLGRS